MNWFASNWTRANWFASNWFTGQRATSNPATGGFFYGLKGGRKRGQEVDEERQVEDAVDVAAQLLPIAKTNQPRVYDLRALLPSPVQAKSTLEGTGRPLAISFAFSADRRLTDDEAIALVLLMAEV